MKGLLLKDIFTLGKQMRIFLLMVLLFACIPGYNMSAFAIVYSALLPVTALAYDERSKWGSLAATMPYSPLSLVLSKYVLGAIGIVLATVATAVLQRAIRLIPAFSIVVEEDVSLLLLGCVALILQAIVMPLMFRFGVEKGRLAFFAVILLAVGVGVWGSSGLTDSSFQPSPLLVFTLTLALSAASVWLSSRFYRRWSR